MVTSLSNAVKSVGQVSLPGADSRAVAGPANANIQAGKKSEGSQGWAKVGHVSPLVAL